MNPERRLPEVDPAARELVLSVGCFLENLAQAAAAEGLSVEVTPGAAPDADGLPASGSSPATALRAAPSGSAGAERCERPSSRAARGRQLSALLEAAGPGAAYLPAGSREGRRIAEATVEAMRQQSYRDGAQRELSRWIRFREEEAGPGPTGSRWTAWRRPGWRVRPASLLRRGSDMGKSFREKGIEQCAKQSGEGAGFLVVGAPDTGVPALLEAGRRFERMALSLRERSIAAHPMSQALEEAPWRAALAAEVGLAGTLQFLVRVGYVSRYPEPVSPRRPLAAFVRA